MNKSGIALIAVLALLAAGPARAQFAGSYTGRGATLSLEQQADGSVFGEFRERDRTLRMEGFLDGGTVLGELYDEADEEFEDRVFVLVPQGSGLSLHIFREDEYGELIPDSEEVVALTRTDGGEAEAAPAPERTPGDPFTGRYKGSFQGVPTSLVLDRSGSRVTGRAEAGGAVYQVQGEVASGAATGMILAPATGESAEFRAEAGEDGLHFTLRILDPASGTLNEVPILFRRESDSDKEPAAGEPAERDPVLVGRWMKSDSMTSGDFSMVSQVTLLVYPDGTYVMGDGRVAGGGGAGSFDSGGGGSGTRGEWKTMDRIVYIRDPGSPNWVPYARYYVEGASLMFTLGDGSREIWKRN